MDHAKTRIRINKNVGGDALDRPLQPIEKTKDPSKRMGELPARFVCIFAPAWEGQKLRFASVEPSAAALVRAAFRWFKSGGVAAKK